MFLIELLDMKQHNSGTSTATPVPAPVPVPQTLHDSSNIGVPQPPGTADDSNKKEGSYFLCFSFSLFLL